ncbi:CPBP family intramembrane glutamic endopeptidase [Pseudonocardia sp. HH130630-07]|uniref:CPBP family intramembrane glutamic endopeptidase n=1 Tax=Pseudonocardia sp. HH130630-07 TaxID=1690815 RepID=UPI000814CFC8|nr:CPBP family intramembrane glutamic endopeptidase [Pseudonocardia sp. HH130630-07]ANY06827.1 hypothetical protein AFB00_11590 [Pseudonocardia sp. HH130630-07]
MARLEQRTGTWWRPLTTVAVVAGLLLAAGIVVGLVFGVVLITVPGVPSPSAMLDDARNPVDMAILFGPLALLVPAVVLGVRWGGGRRGTVHSVDGRVRWSLLLRAAAVVLPACLVLQWGLALLLDPPDPGVLRFDSPAVLALVIGIVLVPLQCAGEEYAFRGLPQQVLGTWLRSPVWGIVLPVPLFMAGHGYDWVGQVDIAVFALCTGFLVWKTGGLELAIVAHTGNNLAVVTMTPAYPTLLEQGEIDPAALLTSVPTTLVLTAGLSLWVSRRHGIGLLTPLRGSGRIHPAPAIAPVG